jgi:dTDP-4-dehydrorhamnose reductase
VYGNQPTQQRAQAASQRTIVVRSGYIFGIGNNFSTFFARGWRGESLRQFPDMTGTPTYAPDLPGLYRLAQIDAPGIYHVVNEGDGVSFLAADAALEMGS